MEKTYRIFDQMFGIRNSLYNFTFLWIFGGFCFVFPSAFLNKLEKKIVELEGKWEKDSRGQLDAITQKSQDFCSSLEKLKQEQDTERKSRLKREGALLEQIETHYKEFEYFLLNHLHRLLFELLLVLKHDLVPLILLSDLSRCPFLTNDT